MDWIRKVKPVTLTVQEILDEHIAKKLA